MLEPERTSPMARLLAGSPDELDIAIMLALRLDGRKTYVDLAKELNTPEATVRKRYQRLVRSGQLQVVALTRLDPGASTYDVSIAISVQPGMLWPVARRIATLDVVRTVSITTGAADIMLSANFATHNELLHFLADQLGCIPGIKYMRTDNVLLHYKRGYKFFSESDETDNATPDALDALAQGSLRYGRKTRSGTTDELDTALMAHLRQDGRVTYAELAKVLGAPEATVRKRFKRLVRDGQLQIVAMPRFQASETTHNVSIALNVAPGSLWSVVRGVSALEPVHYVGIMTGSADVMMQASFPSRDELLAFLTDQLGAITGIESFVTRHILRVIKRNNRWVPIDVDELSNATGGESPSWQ